MGFLASVDGCAGSRVRSRVIGWVLERVGRRRWPFYLVSSGMLFALNVVRDM